MATRTVRRIRWALLALLIGLGGSLVALYLFGRAGQPARTSAGSSLEDTQTEDGVAVVGKDFVYEVDDAGRTVLRIQGASNRQDRDGRVFIEKVAITLLAKDGETFDVSAQNGTWDQTNTEAKLQGEVVARSSQGVEVRSSSFELVQRGRNLISPNAVQFRFRDLATGSAERMRANIDDKLFILAGRVRVDSVPGAAVPFWMRGQRFFLDRQKHHARTDGGALLAYGDHRLRAYRLNLWLTEDESGLQFVRAVKGVDGRIRTTGGQGLSAGDVHFSSRNATAVFDPTGKDISRLELEGTPSHRASLLTVAAGDPPRLLEASFITSDVHLGQIRRAEALGPVVLTELEVVPPGIDWGAEEAREEVVAEDVPGLERADEELEDEANDASALAKIPTGDTLPPGASRIVTGARAIGLFGKEGTLVEVGFPEGFRYRDAEQSIRGENGRFDVLNRIAEFNGKPVYLDSPKGQLQAPRVLFTERTGLLYGEGGCRTKLAEGAQAGALASSPLGGGDGPIWVESAEAFLRNQPRSFLFRGGVRAWQGENLLFADELQGDELAQKLTATGNVRTQWIPTTDAKGGAGPVQVSAGGMVYAQADGHLVYRGSVKALEGKRLLQCDEMTVKLNDERRAEELHCRGNTHIEDRDRGQVVDGDDARYTFGGRKVEVEGKKVQLKDAAGRTISGRRILYDFTEGTAQVQGGAAAPK